MIPFFEDVKAFVQQRINDVLNHIGATGDTGGSATAGTAMAKSNAIITNTAANNTASATGSLSQKLTQINNTVNTINTNTARGVIKSRQSGAAWNTWDTIDHRILTIDPVNISKSIFIINTTSSIHSITTTNTYIYGPNYITLEENQIIQYYNSYDPTSKKFFYGGFGWHVIEFY